MPSRLTAPLLPVKRLPWGLPVLLCLAAWASPALAQAPKAAAAKPAAVAQGAYECWAFNQPRMGLNFRVTGAGKYRASDGSSGTFKYDAATSRVAFTGYMSDVLPKGFYFEYHERQGKPTVSAMSPRGSEASFCERVK